MKDKRIGNDINVMWSLLSQGVPYILEGKDVTLYLRSPYSTEKLGNYVIRGNRVEWLFMGKDQRRTGKYSLILVVNEGEKGMVTTDVCDFVNLVSCGCKVGGTDQPNVEVESIELTSTVELGGTIDDSELRELIAERNVAAVDTDDEVDEPDIQEGYDDSELRASIARLEVTKQDRISDLEQIREGASRGATALQSIPSDYATKNDVAQAIATAITNELNGDF